MTPNTNNQTATYTAPLKSGHESISASQDLPIGPLDLAQQILPQQLFLQRLCLERKRAERSGTNFALFLLHIDDFKVQGTPDEILAGFENIFDSVVIAAHPERGTMTCGLAFSEVELETPLVRAEVGSSLRVGIRAGDILLATVRPEGLSARNVIAGRMVSLAQRDVMVAARVNCGVEMEVHLTLAARDALHLQPGKQVWLVVKTHSCHLMAG